jgi:hypothetical protein
MNIFDAAAHLSAGKKLSAAMYSGSTPTKPEEEFPFAVRSGQMLPEPAHHSNGRTNIRARKLAVASDHKI